MVKHPFLWRGAFAWSSTRWGERVGFAWYKVGLVDNLKKLFRQARPDLVVSVHPLLQVRVASPLWAGLPPLPASLSQSLSLSLPASLLWPKDIHFLEKGQ